jgi:hypothetical protein
MVTVPVFTQTVTRALEEKWPGHRWRTERGRPLNPSNVRNRDHLPRLTPLGLSRFRLHDRRHFHATQLVAAGVDYRTVGDRTGPQKSPFCPS